MNNFVQPFKFRIAVLDLYQGAANQGMRGIQTILKKWSEQKSIQPQIDYFDVRSKNEIPDLSYHAYISSGGSGSPLDSRYEDWDIAWCQWLERVQRWNSDPSQLNKKYVFLICHSFQLACRYFNTGLVCKRRSTAFGIFPVHLQVEGKKEVVFEGLNDTFYAVDNRDYQIIQPRLKQIQQMGGQLLCIEKKRPHVPYERAVMGLRFDPYMIGTQFHPEADPIGMAHYLNQDEKRKLIIENHGEEKLKNMLEHLQDPDKISWTQAHVLPNFLTQAYSNLSATLN